MNPESQAHGELAQPSAQAAGLVPAVAVVRTSAVSRLGHAGPPQAQAIALTPMGLVRALRRRAALALGVALAATVVAGSLAWHFVPSSMFKAQARLHVAALPPKVLFATVETQYGDDYRRFQSTQQTLLKSRFVITKALGDPKSKISSCETLRQLVDPYEWLTEKLKVEFVAGSEVMEISLSGSNAAELALIVNAVKQAYMDEVVNVDARQRTARHEQLKKLKDLYTNLLKSKRTTMRQLAEAVGSDDRETLALRAQFAEEHLHTLRAELHGIQAQKRTLEARLKVMGRIGGNEGETEPAPLSPQAIDRLVDQHPDVADLLDRLAQQQQQLDMAKATAERTARNPAAEPSLGAVKSKLAKTRQLLAQRRKAVRPDVIRRAQEPGAAAPVADAEGLDPARELAMYADLETRLKEEIDAVSKVNHSLAVNTLDLQGNQEEIAQIQSISDKITTEVEALNVELDAPPRIHPLDDASVPVTRDDKKRYMMIAMVTFGSFFGGLFGMAFLELQSRKVETADEVPLELGLSVVGALPLLPARNQTRGVIARRETEKDRYWRNVLLESVDATRTLLLHAARTGSYQVIMITSAVAGEGKTSLASYLATSLARGGRRTLLIDADLRRPMMHRLFDRPEAPGLSELLRGEVEADQAMAATAVEGLTLLPAGRCDRPTLRMISQGGLAPLFERLKQQFDFIIVDTSPILPVADAMLVAQHIDAALFSIYRDVSRKTKVKAAFERLQRLGVPVLGAVVTGDHGGAYGNNSYDSRSSPYPGVPESAAVSSTQSS